jgi:formylglycine-generating enzyme required for sulfatase activity
MGHYELSGNIMEWVNDWYAVYSGGTCTDCANLQASMKRNTKEGFNHSSAHIRAAARPFPTAPDNRGCSSSFRCARAHGAVCRRALR